MSDVRLFVSLRPEFSRRIRRESSARNMSPEKFMRGIVDDYLANPDKYGLIETPEGGVFEALPCTFETDVMQKLVTRIEKQANGREYSIGDVVAHAVTVSFALAEQAAVAAAEAPAPDPHAQSQERQHRLRGFAQQNASRFKL